MDESRPHHDLVLRPLSPSGEGEPVEPLRLTGTGAYVVGRSSEADWQIMDQAISRRHALIHALDRDWYISDLGSRHGTRMNGHRLEPGEQARLRPGDQIHLGYWACRCTDAAPESAGFATLAGDFGTRSEIVTVREDQLSGLAQTRLDALLTACREINEASDLAEITAALTRSAIEGSGCRRVVVVRQISENEFESPAEPDQLAGFELSRSLLAAAADGSVVQLTGADEPVPHGQSILDLKIRTAICAPIMVGAVPEAFLYVDTRGTERRLESDAAAFCQAIAQLGGFAIARLRRTELEDQRLGLERDLTAARRAQDLLMPPKSWSGAGVQCSFDSLAGRLVAGDLFDVVPLDDGRVAFFLGDVSGKGVGAAVLMAAAQAKLRTLLVGSVTLAEAFESVNAYVHERSEENKFITLIAGVIDRGREAIELADAGHGLCCLCPPGAAPRRLDVEGSFPLGVVEQGGYTTKEFPFEAGSRIVVFSDGVVEQTSPGGRQFGLEAALAVLAASDRCEHDVESLVTAVQTHAEGPLADDLTVASLAATGDGPL